MSYGPYELCDWVLASVLGVLDAGDRPAITTSYVGIGLTAWDDACGQLTVAPERVYRSKAFPDEDNSEETCWGGDIAVPILIELVRCVPTPDDNLRAPSAAALSAAHKSVLDDAATVWNGLHAPLPDGWMRARVSQQFAGSSGGAVAVLSRVTLGVEADLWCGPWPS